MLTQSERSRLSELLQEQAALQGKQRDADLAQVRDAVGEIAEAKGWTWEQVCADMGIRLPALPA